MQLELDAEMDKPKELIMQFHEELLQIQCITMDKIIWK